MKMRELEQATGVNRETIRVLLRHGLLPEPERPSPNVANYTQSHVDCVLTVRSLQKEQGLSLKQIKSVLAGGPIQRAVAPAAFPQLESLVLQQLGKVRAMVPLGTVKARNPKAQEDAEAMARIGVVELERRGKRIYLSRTDAELVAIWGAMRAAGFTEARGFTPEVLRMYVEIAEALARREVGAFLGIVAGRVDEGEAANMAMEALNRMQPFLGLLRTKAVLRAFREAQST